MEKPKQHSFDHLAKRIIFFVFGAYDYGVRRRVSD